MARARRFWTQEEVDTLIALWPTMSTLDIAKRLNRLQPTVSLKALRLGLPAKRNAGQRRSRLFPALTLPTAVRPYHKSRISLPHVPTLDRSPDDPPPEHYIKEQSDG